MTSMLICTWRVLRSGNAKCLKIVFAVIAALFFFVPAADARAADGLTAVRVGKVAYSVSEVQAYWDSIAQMASELGYTLTDEDIAQYRDGVIESYVSMGILENKYTEFGLNHLTAEEQGALEKDAERLYADRHSEVVKSIAEQYGKTREEAEQYAPALMGLYGYTMDTAREEALRNLKEERILAFVTADIPKPDEAEVAAYYGENFVAPSREAYADDIEAFETDVLYYGGLSYYIPEGYRYVRHILLPADPDARARAEAGRAELAEVDAALTTAYNKLYGYQALGEDTDEPQQEYDALVLAKQEKETQLQAVLDEALALHADELAEIQARLEAGETFGTLMAEYSRDTQMPQEGYMVCAGSVLWAEAFRDAAMALQKVGDVGDPVTTSAGVHIIEYTSDAPAGAVALEGGLKEEMEALALRAKQYEVLKALILKWRDEYAIETNPALLSMPEVLQH